MKKYLPLPAENYVGENLSYDNENISSMKAEEAAQKQFSSLSVMMIINKDAKTLAHNVHGKTLKLWHIMFTV